MLFEEVLEALGALPIALAVLAPFWIGDDALSPAFRDDVARWLRGVAVVGGPGDAHSTVARVVLSLFERVFGGRAASRRFIGRSAAMSLALTTTAIVAVEAVNHAEREPVWVISDPGRTMRLFAWLTLTNVVADYASLVETRFVLSRMGSSVSRDLALVTLDALLTLAVFLAAYLGVFVVLISLLPTFSSGAPDVEGAFTLLLAYVDRLRVGGDAYWVWGLRLTEDQALLAIPLVTTFVTSAWIWAAALGGLGIRLLSASGPIMRGLIYALPVDERPVRSIGVVATLIVLAALLAGAAFQQLLGAPDVAAP